MVVAVTDSTQVGLSVVDEERFGIRTARVAQVTLSTLPDTLDFCQTNRVEFLIARCLTTEVSVAQAMEREGFVLMDVLVYYARDLVRLPIPSHQGGVLVRPIQLGEEKQVKVVAEGAFRGYLSHYHADPRLERAKCDETYVSWAVRSCVSRRVADQVLVADEGGTILGFATLRLNSPEESEGVLFGVSPAAQGRGVYRSFMIGAMEWTRTQGRSRMLVSTQITNLAVQKVWTRVGFEPSHSYYTFHKWFDTEH